MSLNFGMPVGFDAALSRKYQILGQDADANTLDATARANLTNVNAGLAPGLAKASEAQSNAQAGLLGSQTTAEDQLNQSLTKLGIGGNSVIKSLLGRIGGYGLGLSGSSDSTAASSL